MKSHMHNPTPSNRTRCGLVIGDIGNFYPMVFEYGSPNVTCKSCIRFYNSDLAEEMEASA